MTKTTKILAFLIFIEFVFFSGIGRDDVKLKNYYKFASDSVFNCIGEIYLIKSNKFQNSFVLIDSLHILTTAHGLYIGSDTLINDSVNVLGKNYSIKRPINTQLRSPLDFYIKLNGTTTYCKTIIIHPEYDDDFHSLGLNDIAIIELKNPINIVTPAKIYTDSFELNKRGIICGYGENLQANKFPISNFFKRHKMAGENMIDSLAGNIIDNKLTLLFGDIDNPNTNECNRLGSPLPLPLEFHASSGDCGGGLFIQQDNIWYLAGINFGPSYYSDMKIYGKKFGYYGFLDGWTRVSAYANWIKANSLID